MSTKAGQLQKFHPPQGDQDLVPGLLSFPNCLDQMEVLTGGSVFVAEGDDLEEHVHRNTSYQPVCQEYYRSWRVTTLGNSSDRIT